MSDQKKLLKDKPLINYLGNVAVKLSSAQSINELSKVLTDIIHTLIEVKYTGHYFWDPLEKKLKLYDALGFTEDDKIHAESTVMDRHPGWVFKNKKMFHVKDTFNDKTGISITGNRSFNVRSRLFIPVLDKGKAVGCIGFASVSPNYFTSHHIAVLSFICNIAGAVYNSIIEISKEKQYQEDLKKALNEAEIAKKAKELFLAKMSHEMRTPMNAIIGMSSLFKTTDLNSEQKEYLDAILFSSESLLNLINDVLDFSKLNNETIKFEKKLFNLKDLVLKLKDLYELKTIGSDVKFILNIDPEIKYVIADEHRIKQILLNLLDNAIKFTSNGSVKLGVDQMFNSEKSTTIKFSVKDTGIGISKNNLTSIFENFRQEDESITRKYGGTGLGLTICKEIASKYKSELKVKSKINKGSEFYFIINFKKNPSKQKKLLIDNDFLYDFSNLKVLVVEDNELNKLYIQKLLSKKGIYSDSANNGIECLNLFKANSYDLILMDLQMPVMNGIEATSEIRKIDIDIPIIAITANTVENDIKNIFEIGVNSYIFKPFKPNELYEELNKFYVEY